MNIDIMWIWFGVGIFFIIIELLNYGLISIWFAVGAFSTMPFSKLSSTTQFYIFTIASLLSLILMRKGALNYLKGNKQELDRVSQSKVKIESVQSRGVEKIYTVKLDGKYWEAISDELLQVGDIVYVEKIKGNKLILKNKKVDEL